MNKQTDNFCVKPNTVVEFSPEYWANLKNAHKQSLEQYHKDPSTGFVAKSPSLYFGVECKHLADAESIDFWLSRNKSISVTIEMEDFHVLYLSLHQVIGSAFDEYGEYRLTFKKWHEVLNTACTILSFKTFDEMFDELITWKASKCKAGYLLWNLNHSGAELWKRRDEYMLQIEELSEWTKLIMKENDCMIVYGY